ncbi:MAG: hypothetical protein RIN56_13340 [Sporomusaceae bacterium]|nr:hypothetical protein [Sporomusaceae bacterium]MDR7867792.1 hypothetical protein [Sporomusaceae bacterium]
MEQQDFDSGYEYARRHHLATWQGYSTGTLKQLAAVFVSAGSGHALGQARVIEEILAGRAANAKTLS